MLVTLSELILGWVYACTFSESQDTAPLLAEPWTPSAYSSTVRRASTPCASNTRPKLSEEQHCAIYTTTGYAADLKILLHRHLAGYRTRGCLTSRVHKAPLQHRLKACLELQHPPWPTAKMHKQAEERLQEMALRTMLATSALQKRAQTQATSSNGQ